VPRETFEDGRMTGMTTQGMLLGPTNRSFGRNRAGVERSARIEEAAQGQIDRAGPVGVSLEATDLSCQSRSGFGRPNNVGRARRLLEKKLAYVYDRSFDKPDAEATFFAPMTAGAHGPPAEPRLPTGSSRYLAGLYGKETQLSPEKEAYLFVKMNYLKYRASKLREALDPASTLAPDLDEIERLQEEARAVKDQIVRANLGLVASIARRRAGPDRNYFELVSEGNLSLVLAVENFDVSRGFKFSTYASCAIMRNLTRWTVKESCRRHRFVTSHPEFLEAAADRRTEEREGESDRPCNHEAVQGMLGRLDDRERQILVGRYGLGGAGELTMAQLGEELGISRERVRQLELRAREKLRRFALEQGLDPTAA
jgi:RNA polymerase primary sigma factor